MSLQAWMNTQLAYYSRPALHERYLPPRFERRAPPVRTAGTQ